MEFDFELDQIGVIIKRAYFKKKKLQYNNNSLSSRVNKNNEDVNNVIIKRPKSYICIKNKKYCTSIMS